MISEGYVTNGATVYISSRDAKACEQAAKELNALGKGKAHAIPANFYSLDDVKKLAEELGKREGSKAIVQSIQTILQLTQSLLQSSTSSSTTPAPTGVHLTTNTLLRPSLESSPSTCTASST
jgi:NAD(P)-dependent dehydrogenase (short-subunit alcohol dehydrogenase family)